MSSVNAEVMTLFVHASAFLGSHYCDAFSCSRLERYRFLVHISHFRTFRSYSIESTRSIDHRYCSNSELVYHSDNMYLANTCACIAGAPHLQRQLEGTCARDHLLGLAERRAASFRPPQSPPTANLTTLEHSDLDRRHGRQISTLAATDTTQNLLSPPTQPSKWRTTAASLSTCKRPPEICSDSRESPLRLENRPMEDLRVYKLT
jgi:hypothetical protein